MFLRRRTFYGTETGGQGGAGGGAGGAAGAGGTTSSSQGAGAAGGTSTTTGQGTQQGAGTASTQAATTAEAELRITLPAGMQEDAEVMGSLKTWAKEHGISAKAAQALVDSNLALGKKRAEAQAKDDATKWDTWKQGEAKKLRDLWGKDFDGKMDGVNKLIRVASQAAGLKPEDVVAHLGKNGTASDSVVVQILSLFAPLVADDKLNLGGKVGSNTTEPTREQALRQMYDKSPEWMFQKRT